MKTLKLLLISIMFIGCGSTPPVPPPTLNTKPTKVSVIIPDKLAEIAKWVSLTTQKCAAQLGIEEPPVVKLFYIPSPSNEEGSYLLGVFYPSTKEIHVWLRHPFGHDYLLDQIKHTVYHEFLHWYDSVTDQKFWKDRGLDRCPLDHNSIFEERIKSLNWT